MAYAVEELPQDASISQIVRALNDLNDEFQQKRVVGDGVGILAERSAGATILKLNTRFPELVLTPGFWGIVKSYELRTGHVAQWDYTIEPGRLVESVPGEEVWTAFETPEPVIARNASERINPADSVGLHGNGITQGPGTEYPAGYSIQPCPVGTPRFVRQVTITNSTDPNLNRIGWEFEYEQGDDGTCNV